MIFSFLFARLKNLLNSSDGSNDLSSLKGSNRYNPFKVLTRDSTVYSQFLNNPPFGQDEIIMTSFDDPCNLCPVVALLVLTGNWVIRHVNFNQFLAK